MHRIPHPDGSHGLPSTSGGFDQPWRPPYTPAFETHPADQRRTSSAPQPPLHPHAYSVMPNRELPQLPPDGPYARQSSLPGPPTHTPPETHPPPPPPHPAFRPTINGTSHEPTPHSAPPEYRPPVARMSFPPPDTPGVVGDAPPPSQALPPAQYTPPVPHLSQTPTPYDSAFYPNQGFGMRHRKAARAQQACDQCRARKAKCDEGRPACSHCKENNLICVYKEVPPHKQEKATQQILDRLQQFEDAVTERIGHLLSMQVEHGNQITSLLQGTGLPETKTVQAAETQKQSFSRLSKPDIADLLQKTETKDEAISNFVNRELEKAAEGEPQMLVTGEDGELSIPVEHTTAAHKLLMWPSIKALLAPREYDEDYVMRLEEERGLISVYGRGEGQTDSEELTASSAPNGNSTREHAYTNDAAAAAAAFWPPVTHQNGTPARIRPEPLDENGYFITDAETVRRLYASYLDHIHKLHPFLNQTELEERLEIFIERYCPPSTAPAAPILNGNGNGTGDFPRSAKRKRSCETLHGAGCDVQSPSSITLERLGCRRVEKTLKNAINLLVLALGSICAAKPPLPGPVTEIPRDFREESIPGPTSRNMLSRADSASAAQGPHPPQGSFHSQPDGQSFSSMDNRRASSDRTVHSHNRRRLRNMDVIPGLAYYAYATQILGSLQGANSLDHVQAALLAGLYAGQLAHPFQSHGWIYQAARACQVLVRTKRYEQYVDGPLKDSIDFAYWTCLQLESDILAELDLPASGISRSEGRISLPKGKYTLTLPNEISAPSTMMMFFYSAQIHLRKVLNRVHTDLYKVERKGESRWSSHVQEILSMNLELWRSSLPEVMRWKDTDPPSKDINVARMRAKYYGARYIIHRPLLFHALHFANDTGRSASVSSPTESAISGSKSQQVSPSVTHSQRAIEMARLASDAGPTSRSAPTPTPGGGAWASYAYRDLQPKMRRACKVCIDSAILSTEAFDGIEGRPVVTNIFGTAHAQFGNMLVLSATYMSSLSELVDRTDLERLMKRTIRFLLQSREISPSLRADAKILSEIYEKIFGDNIEALMHCVI
ncbi:putative C6 finger domain protein [Aspergillus saccharolyticus JOP 1030-1]|uniref:Putative C6 finger domain protein n=1 Tax=Aspergillus saccharolyticus JOP 1030-1 TaxID=1450539 RepID=A0A318ZX54_9EURO|nr:putative C6 finger domain protein [Aspergillus saccharolyticus JOP 1030-1]PYH40042.1 putative C6 finger domain protein [Aspergillus saccharolyticus JOP 1030-1]